MNKRTSYGLLLLGIFVAPFFAFAQTSSCISIQGNLKYNLRDENTNGEVSILQGFLSSGNFLNSSQTGYFGSLTLQAVKDFQNKNGLSADGIAGPATRAKIKSLTCSGDTSPSSSSNTTNTISSNAITKDTSIIQDSVSTGALQPSQLITSVGSCGVNLSWTKVSGAVQYMIYRNEAFMDAVKSLIWVDKETSSGASYVYKIIAIDRENILDTITDSYGYSISNKINAISSGSCAQGAQISTSQVSTPPISTVSSVQTSTAIPIECQGQNTNFSPITGTSCQKNTISSAQSSSSMPPTDLINAYWDGTKWAQDPNDPLFGWTVSRYVVAVNTPGTPQFKAYSPPGYHFNGSAWVTNSFAPGYHFDANKNNWVPDN